LLQLAQELKDEADKTEQTDVLSLSLIHRAEEIEKLARQINGLARSACHFLNPPLESVWQLMREPLS
jgi:hypothetical protein